MPKTFMRSYMAAVVSHCQRWVDVTLDLGGEDLTYLYGLPDDAFPLLEKFALRDSCGTFSHSLSQALFAAPRLHMIALDHSIIDGWALKWSNLTSLSLATTSANPHRHPAQLNMVYLFTALKCCERLRSLSLTFPPEFQYEENTNVVHIDDIMDVQMVNLESLTMSMDTELVGTFADNLRLPNLKELSLQTHGIEWDESNGDWDAFLDFVDEFSAGLERVTFNGPNMTTTQWDDLLSVLSKISELTIVDSKSCMNWARILKQITVHDGAKCIFLRKISLLRSPLFGPEEPQISIDVYQAILSMVWGRCIRDNSEAFDPLESLTLLDTDLARMEKIAPGVYASLQTLVSRGLGIVSIQDDL